MRLFKKLRRRIDYLSQSQIDLIRQAFELAATAHQEQKRFTGEPYVTHPVAVACILADMKMDYQSIASALLHDVLEDTPVTKSQIIQQFGPQISQLVDGVTKLAQFEQVTPAQKQAENFCKMVLAMSQDIRVIIIKLADRLHNMRTLESLPASKRRRIAKETLELYAPIAKRLGMREFSVEMEELGFAAYYPNRFKTLKEAIEKARGNRKRLLGRVDKTIRDKLDENNIPYDSLTGREKHLYSIYRKMRAKHLSLNEVMDVYAFRIITNNADDCYRVLGAVHGLYKPVIERFKDYIAIPKANGYQSLHTTLFGPYGLPIEIQIRSKEMDRMASNGIAAHWRYKSEDHRPKRSQLRAEHWINELLELRDHSGNSMQFLENLKINLYPDEVYVFTPKGEIKALPAGSTPVDFAYSVHSDIGNTCVAAKIDRQLAPLSTPLKSGQSVDVLTNKHATPNPAWLDFVVTSKARTCIRHYLKSRSKHSAVKLGRQLLNRALMVNNQSLKNVEAEVLAKVVSDLELDSDEALFAEIGMGHRAPMLVVEQLKLLSPQNYFQQESKTQQPLTVSGTEGMLVTFASCCHPIPGDPIVGILNKGSGVTVHVDECERIKGLQGDNDRLIPMRWATNVSIELPAKISIQVENMRGILGKIAIAIANAGANIEDIDVEDKDGKHFLVLIELTVKGKDHLAKVLNKIGGLSTVMKIARKIN